MRINVIAENKISDAESIIVYYDVESPDLLTVARVTWRGKDFEIVQVLVEFNRSNQNEPKLFSARFLARAIRR